MTRKATAPPGGITLRPDAEALGAFWGAVAQFHADAVWEVRGPKTKRKGPREFFGTVSGYFTDRRAFIAALRGISGEDAEALYMTLNPVKSALLARAANRLQDAARESTQDSDILWRTTLLIDLDPERPAGISATDAERVAALELRDSIRVYLQEEEGWPDALATTMSGNGGGLLYRIHLPNDQEAMRLIEGVLKVLAAAFNTNAVTVDVSNSNAARLTKIIGTVAAKGDNLPERPWRLTTGAFHPEAQPVPLEALKRVAELAPSDSVRPIPASDNGHSAGRWDLRELLRQAEIGWREKPKPGYRVLQLNRCLTSRDHTDGAALLEFDSGAVAYRCLHNRCAEKRWEDVRGILVSRKTGEAAGIRVENLTDLGNAKRLVARHGRDLRYCHLWRTWLVWDGCLWRKDESGEVVRRAKETALAIYPEAGIPQDEELRKAIAKHAARAEAESRVKAMIALAESEPGIPVAPGDLDRDLWLLNVANGTLDLRTGCLREHRQDDLITKLAPVPFEREAPCPTWERFLAHIFDGNDDLISFIQWGVGYSLTGDTREQCLFIEYGTGSNGKSTKLRILTDLLGDYAQWTPTETLLLKRSGAVTNDLARLRGARFVAAAEAESGRRLAEALVKMITGGDRIVARFLFGEFFEFLPTFKVWLAVNHRPVVRETTLALWRRIRLIPFTVTIPDEQQDKTMTDRLRAELPGILAWAVRGCLAWQREGLGVPDEVRQATSAYQAAMDVMAEFLTECCEQVPSVSATAAELYAAYRTWCESNGERPESQRRFGEALTERGFVRVRSGGVRMWRGLRLRE